MTGFEVDPAELRALADALAAGAAAVTEQARALQPTDGADPAYAEAVGAVRERLAGTAARLDALATGLGADAARYAAADEAAGTAIRSIR